MIGASAIEQQATPSPRRFRSEDELQIREAVEAWGRAKWPGARVVHELVVGRGVARADMAFISHNHFAAIEIKSLFDGDDRLLHQAAMFRLVAPELWIIADPIHDGAVELVRYLLPTIGAGHALFAEPHKRTGPRRVVERGEAQPFRPHSKSMLSLLWVAELADEASRARVWSGKAPAHARLVAAMERLNYKEQLAAVCRQLRARDAMWRADPSIREVSNA